MTFALANRQSLFGCHAIEILEITGEGNGSRL